MVKNHFLKNMQSYHLWSAADRDEIKFGTDPQIFKASRGSNGKSIYYIGMSFVPYWPKESSMELNAIYKVHVWEDKGKVRTYSRVVAANNDLFKGRYKEVEPGNSLKGLYYQVLGEK